jgi:two-component system, chemotaxis family, protein-glutamate methylesterase/glutaminase
MQNRRIVVVGASAGGIDALRVLAAALPPDFAAPVCVVVHTAPQSPGILHEILARAGSLPAISPRNRERLLPGRIYVAPPDCHLLVEPGRLRVTKGPRENRFRPAIDPLFRTAAQVYGPGAIGVVLTGHLDDGTAGLWAIKRLGGTAVVQDPADAMYPSMPESALRHVEADHRVPLADIAPLLARLTAAPVAEPEPASVPEAMEVEVKIAKEHNPVDAGLERIGEPSSFACPECHGVLLQLKEGGRMRFRCHTGHAYSLDSLLAEIGESIEASVWNTIRALEEGGLLLERMGAHAHVAQGAATPAALLERGRQWRKQADSIRQLINDLEPAAIKS